MEGVGIGVLVALLLAATAAWLVREVRPPDEPPAVIAAVSKPLVRDPWPLEYRYPLPPPPFAIPRGRDDEPIGRALRAAGRGVRVGIDYWIDMQHRCTRATGVRFGERVVEFLRDPAGLDRDSVLSGDAGAYIERLRALPGREAALTATEDACTVAIDVAADVGEELLRRRLARGGGTSRRP